MVMHDNIVIVVVIVVVIVIVVGGRPLRGLGNSCLCATYSDSIA